MKKKKQKTEVDFFDELLEVGSVDNETCGVDKDGWPESAPLLTERDLTWNFESDTGRKDLLVWLERTFDLPDGVRRSKAYTDALSVLCKCLKELTHLNVQDLYLFLELAKRNKSPSLKTQAKAWNAMLRHFGYSNQT